MCPCRPVQQERRPPPRVQLSHGITHKLLVPGRTPHLEEAVLRVCLLQGDKSGPSRGTPAGSGPGGPGSFVPFAELCLGLRFVSMEGTRTPTEEVMPPTRGGPSLSALTLFAVLVYPRSTVAPKYEMEHSRNKQFINVKLRAVLSSVMKPGAILLRPNWDVNHPVVQHVHVARATRPFGTWQPSLLSG